MTHTKTNSQIVTYARRHETGCIATLSDGVSRHFVGNGAAATRAVAVYCDLYGLRVLCLSTPSTIYRDLQGDRGVEGLHKKGRRDDLHLPERYMLAAIGRTDLLA